MTVWDWMLAGLILFFGGALIIGWIEGGRRGRALRDGTPDDGRPDIPATAKALTIFTLIVAGGFAIVKTDLLISAEEIAAREEKARQEQDRRRRDAADTMATVACQQAILNSVRFPSKAVFDPGLFNIPSVGPVVGQAGVTGVRGTVELMNGLGLMVPHRYACNLKAGRIIASGVTP